MYCFVFPPFSFYPSSIYSWLPLWHLQRIYISKKSRHVVAATKSTIVCTFLTFILLQYIKLKIEQNPTKNRDELRKLGKLNISCSTIFYADIRKLNHSMNPWFDSFIVKQQLSIKEIPIGTTSSEISYQVGDMYSTWRCCWNVYEVTFQQHLHVEYISPTLYLYMRQHFSSTFMWSTYLPLYICIWGNISAAPSCGVHISHFM
jgi:hypothetical protein